MENPEIDNLLQSLAPSAEWQPNARRALAQVKARRTSRPRNMRWTWAVASVSAVCFALFALPERGTCGQSPADAACKKTVETGRNYKEAGSPLAPVTLEIYSDYECPACASFFLEVLPSLEEKYVKTGKVKLLHRDFPLGSHAYAGGAARYANAAGETGVYDAVVLQLFRTQSLWKVSGDIDGELSKAIPLAEMRKIRQLVPTESLSWDIATGTMDGINQTPAFIVVHAGKRERVSAEDLDRVLASEDR